MKVKKCCCCVPIDIGVMILGALLWFSLLGELDYFNPIRMGITVTVGCIFLFMVFQDSDDARKLFFLGYLVYQISSIVFAIQQTYAILEEK